MNSSLTRYEFEKEVGSIHAYNFNFEHPLTEPYFFVAEIALAGLRGLTDGNCLPLIQQTYIQN